MEKIYLLIAIIAEVIATSALKESDGFRYMIPGIIVVVGYAISFFFLANALKYIPVGVAYAIWSGLGIVLTVLIGYFYYGDRLSIGALIGIGIILIGTLLVNLTMESR